MRLFVDRENNFPLFANPAAYGNVDSNGQDRCRHQRGSVDPMRLFTGIEAIRAQIGQSSKTLPDSVYCPNWSNEGEYWTNITLVGHSDTSYPHSMPVFIGIYGLHLADSLAHQNLFDRIVMQQVEIQPSLMALYSCMSSSEMDYYDSVLVGEAVQRAKEAQGEF